MRVVWALAGALAGACGEIRGADEQATAGGSTESTGGEGDSGTGEAGTTTAGSSEGGSTAAGSDVSGSSESGAAPAACDNGMVEPGELCLDPVPRIHEIPPMALDMQLGDVDLDGHVDAVVMFLDHSSALYDLRVYSGDGAGGFADGPVTAGDPTQVAFLLDDVDTDGALDIALAAGSSQCFGEPCMPTPSAMRLFVGAGDGTFAAPLDFSTSPSPGQPRTGDLDGDGLPEIVVPERGPMTEPGVSVYRGTGDAAVLAAPQFHATSFHVSRIAVDDVDGDGRLDVLGVLGGTAQGLVLRGDGEGGLTEAETFPAGAGPGDVAVLAAASGITPLLVLPQPQGTTATIVGRARAGWQLVGEVSVMANPAAMSAADLTQDDLVDFVVANWQPNLATIRVARGDGTFDEPESLQPGAHPIAARVADMNEDGAMDVVVATSWGGRLSVFASTP